MDYLDLAFKVKTSDLMVAEDIATTASPYGFYTEDYSDLETKVKEIAHMDLIDEDLIKKDREHAIIHIYLSEDRHPQEIRSFVEERLKECNVDFEFVNKLVKEEDWSTAWKKYYHPIELSDKLVICPSWEKFTAKPGQKILYLDPSMAFGTGTHETTRLCLKLEEKYIKPEQNMLDVGCGSGILALASRLLGVKNAVGVDIDKVAVRVANENQELNKIDNVKFIAGNLADQVTGPFDIICANIVADAIIMLAKDMPRLMHKDSVCIVSGIINTRLDDVLNALAKLPLELIDKESDANWYALAYRLKR